MKGAKTFFDSWYLNNRFLRNSGPLKIRLLQCYVVLWIHNIDVICISKTLFLDLISQMNFTSFIFWRYVPNIKIKIINNHIKTFFNTRFNTTLNGNKNKSIETKKIKEIQIQPT